MSLTISLRVPDGIVLAADSLSTQRSALQLMAEFHAKCPKCETEFPIKDLPLPAVHVPSSTGSFAQKVTSLKTKDNKHSLGIATFGMGVITGKTIYYHLRMLNQIELFENLAHASEKISEHLLAQLKIQFGDLSKYPDDSYPLGFQLVGYEDEIGKTIQIYIGKEIKREIRDTIGCTIGGQGLLVKKMWELKNQAPEYQLTYESLSLQDACDLAEYFIRATADFQRFSNMMPDVGGAVDIALITKYSGFKWIKCKELTKILEADKGA
ncbi:MAG: hypothetical protein HQ591_12525 [candidate division Zixibacteria bacterium]|nr:hypothetical protein [Candidatus Tariuqbacter arcticus]